MKEKTIGLCLIVKNEANIIIRCLESARQIIDYVLVVDTGSTDGTQQLILDYLAREDLRGHVMDEPWQNFAYNRSFALRALQNLQEVDYRMVMDADMVIHYAADFDSAKFKKGLTAEIYQVLISYGELRYYSPLITLNGLDCHYRGVLHEFLECPRSSSRETASGFWFTPIQDSARSQNPNKFRDDAVVLKKALLAEKDPFMISRYTFYLAQSYRDAGELRKSMDAYKRRSTQGGWPEEIWYALQQIALLQERLNFPEGDVINSYLTAYQFRPQRAESLVELARFCRLREKYALARLFADKGRSLERPEDLLFIDAPIYEWRALDEYAVASYWTGDYADCKSACERLLESNHLPPTQRARVIDNLNFAKKALGSESILP